MSEDFNKVSGSNRLEDLYDAYVSESKDVGAFVGFLGGIGSTMALDGSPGFMFLSTTGGSLAGIGLGYVTGKFRGKRAVRRLSSE